jgi:phosphate ABC transporter phosphate-binding protein
MRRTRRLSAIIVLWLLVGVLASQAALADGPTVTGAGSTWSQVAIDQWRSDVALQGISINYSGVGSTAGRGFYIAGNVDFAVSEIPFLPNEVSSLKQGGISYQYLPIVAGGTSMLYNLRGPSGQIRNLQLSPRTAAEIFTGQITSWDDAAIKKDNPGLALPKLPIVPVTRSDGSGTSAQFSAFFASQVPDVWRKFCGDVNPPISPCGSTSFWPQFGISVQQRGSDGIANYVANPSLGNGSIGYAETAYALARNLPVVSVLNRAGNYVQPTAQNVAIALTHATLNADRTQNLGAVYTASEAAAYPISSYSYMITRTSGFDPAKGEVLGKFIEYFVCAGQQSAETLGYSPLPENLVQAAFDAVKQIPGAPPPPGLNAKECPNPQVTGKFDPGGGQVGTQQPGGDPSASAPASTGPRGSTVPGASIVPTATSTIVSSDQVGVFVEAASRNAEAAQPPSALPLALAGLVLVLLVFGPLLLRLRSNRRGP